MVLGGHPGLCGVLRTKVDSARLSNKPSRWADSMQKCKSCRLFNIGLAGRQKNKDQPAFVTEQRFKLLGQLVGIGCALAYTIYDSAKVQGYRVCSIEASQLDSCHR